MQSSRPIIIGIFLAGGLLLFAVGLFWIGDRQQLFAESLELQTRFRNLSGLSRGAPVRVAGVEAGQVLNIEVPSNPDLPFTVRFRVTTNFRPIMRSDSVATIQTDGLVGNKFLQIGAGTGAGEQAVDGSALPSREPIEVADLMDRANEAARSANEAVLDIRGGINNTVNALLDLNRETTRVIEGIGNQVAEIGGQIEAVTATGVEIAQNLNGIVDDVRQGQGSIGKLLTDDQLFDSIRSTVVEVESAADNLEAVTGNIRRISDEIRDAELGSRLDQVGTNVEALTVRAQEMLGSFQGSGSGALMSDVRQTLDNTNRAMANLADNTEALKRNFLFSGFFDARGFYDMDAVSLSDYQDSRFLASRQRIAQQLQSAGLFADAQDEGTAVLTDEGRSRIDRVMASFLRYSKTDPLVVEAYDADSSPEALLRARARAVAVRNYIVSRFELRRTYVGVMPIVGSDARNPDLQDSIGLVLFAARGR